MHLVLQVLIAGMSWAAGIKTADTDPKIDAIMKEYGKLKESLQRYDADAFATLEEVEDRLKKLRSKQSLHEIPLDVPSDVTQWDQNKKDVSDHAHALLALLDDMHKEAKYDTWEPRIEPYA